jgi:hypothetical protein
MRRRAGVTRAIGALLGAVVVGACSLILGPEVTCGPLDAAACAAEVEVIQSALERARPDQRVEFIEFVNEVGDAHVLLSDGTEVGWGGEPR